MTTKPTPLADIRIDGGTQPRTGIDEGVVQEYATAILAGDEFPPLDVFFDGTHRWLASGYHRYFAHKSAGAVHVYVVEHAGTRRDAILFAVGTNAQHGLRRTNEDKRRSVRLLLEDAEWGQWSDREIARRCHVDNKTVAAVRAELTPRPSEEFLRCDGGGEERNYERGGKVHKQRVKPAGANVATPREQPTSGPVTTTTADDDGPSAAELLDELQRENETLQATVKAMEADDKAAEVAKWKRIADTAQRGQGEAMERAAQAVKREEWSMRQLRRCGKAVGEDNPENIAARVEAMARSVRKVAA